MMKDTVLCLTAYGFVKSALCSNFLHHSRDCDQKKYIENITTNQLQMAFSHIVFNLIIRIDEQL